jgi:hypothetical protein
MADEPVEHGIIDIAPSDSRQAKPAGKMFGRCGVASTTARTIASGLKMIREPGQVAGQIVDVMRHRNVAAILEEANETANQEAVVPVLASVRAETGAAALVVVKMIDQTLVYLADGNPRSRKPGQEVSYCCAIPSPGAVGASVGQLIEKGRQQCIIWRRGTLRTLVRVGGGSLKGSHVGPFGLWKPKGPYRKGENYAEQQTVSADAEQEIPGSTRHNRPVNIIRFMPISA